jgi:hypothetical protein
MSSLRREIELLQQTITDKWAPLALGLLDYDPSCALCSEYYSCYNCPIGKDTGASGCVKTPYRKWRKAWIFYGIKSPEACNAARDMLEYLCDLIIRLEAQL